MDKGDGAQRVRLKWRSEMDEIYADELTRRQLNLMTGGFAEKGGIGENLEGSI